LLADPTVYLTRDRVIRVDGRGSRGWLHSLLTVDLRASAPNAARYALLLTAAGGIVSDAWVVERAAEGPDAFALVLPTSLAERVLALLRKYQLNEDISLAFDDASRVIAIQGSGAHLLVTRLEAALPVYACERLGVAGFDAWVAPSKLDRTLERLSVLAREMGGAGVDENVWSCAEVALGVPRAGVDFDEDTSPHEAGLAARAVSFSKGCYLGQERVARQQRRGGLARRLVQFEATGSGSVSPGSKVRDSSGAEAGQVTSVAQPASRSVLALGYVTPNLAEPGTFVTLDGMVGRVRRVVGVSTAAGGTA
jgi:folate-binding protein YgfZ